MSLDVTLGPALISQTDKASKGVGTFRLLNNWIIHLRWIRTEKPGFRTASVSPSLTHSRARALDGLSGSAALTLTVPNAVQSFLSNRLCNVDCTFNF